jgi:hypothetical protein
MTHHISTAGEDNLEQSEGGRCYKSSFHSTVYVAAAATTTTTRCRKHAREEKLLPDFVYFFPPNNPML